MSPNLSLLGSRWNQDALLIGSHARQSNESLLAELQQGQHFCVAIWDGGYKVDKTGIYGMDAYTRFFLSKI